MALAHPFLMLLGESEVLLHVAGLAGMAIV
jgi:hypothetical protein